jgi:hypothetical protein
MPTEFVGQNGVKVAQSTKIAVTGCSNAKQKGKRASHTRRGRRKGRHKGK